MQLSREGDFLLVVFNEDNWRAGSTRFEGTWKGAPSGTGSFTRTFIFLMQALMSPGTELLVCDIAAHKKQRKCLWYQLDLNFKNRQESFFRLLMEVMNDEAKNLFFFH